MSQHITTSSSLLLSLTLATTGCVSTLSNNRGWTLSLPPPSTDSVRAIRAVDITQTIGAIPLCTRVSFTERESQEFHQDPDVPLGYKRAGWLVYPGVTIQFSLPSDALPPSVHEVLHQTRSTFELVRAQFPPYILANDASLLTISQFDKEIGELIVHLSSAVKRYNLSSPVASLRVHYPRIEAALPEDLGGSSPLMTLK